MSEKGGGLLEFRILGPLEVVSGGRKLEFRGSRERSLLALLVLNANRTVSSERLAEDLWSGAPPEGAAGTLRVYVSRVRRGLGDAGGVLVTRASGYLLQVEPGAIDAVRFEALVGQGREQAAACDHQGAAATLREALALWRGPALAEVADAPSARAEAVRLEEARLAALEDRIEADLAAGGQHSVIAELEALTSAHPLRERLWAQRMLALYRAGRQAEALRAYQDLRRILGEQLGIDPSPALGRLETAILRHEPELEWSHGTAPHPPGQGDSAGGVVTFLFTDVVGSTELLDQLGDDVAEETRQAHFRLLREAVAAHGGVEVKSLGDGLMVVFASPLAALRCAVAMQEAVAREGARQSRPLAVRIGLHAGEPVCNEGDFFGTPVVIARRLCDRADGGQILASALVRDLVGGRGDHAFAFRHLGGLTLKGLADPVAACEVLGDRSRGVIETAASEPGQPGQLPLPLGREESFPLVGRVAELAKLHVAWTAARSGGRHLLMVAGEPGIGKSRLAAEFARQVHAEGGLVLFGRCDEGMGVPYQPFVEALDRYLRTAPAPVLGRLAGELARLVPEVAERVRGLPYPLRSDPETERYRLFDAVVAWLSAASRAAPMLLVLDDLQWATKPTLLLLRHLGRSEEPLSLLVVAAYRDSVLDMTPDFADTLVEVLRQPGVDRVTLSGLDEAGVAALMESQARHELTAEGRALAGVLHAETAGNPFFVKEMLRHLAEKGAIVYEEGRWVTTRALSEVIVPDSVRELLGRRLTRLPDQTTEALALAAVLGERFELAVLAKAGSQPESAVLAALRPAVAARLVEETGVGSYRFAHALVRATLEDALGPTRRAQLHRLVGAAIEIVHAGAIGEHLPALTHHWARASPSDPAKAVDYTRCAGDRALSQLAHDEAVAYYRQALELLGATEETPDEAQRLELLIALGEAERRAGDPAHRGTLLEAARLAQERGDVQHLAQAALANTRGTLMSAVGSVDDERVAVLGAALEALGGDDLTIRARLLATLGLELTFSTEREWRLQLSHEALALARRIGDPTTLVHVLSARYQTINAPVTLPECLANTAELVQVAERVGEPAALAWARGLRVRANMESGHVEEAREILQLVKASAAELGQPTLQWLAAYSDVALSLFLGRIEEAERLADEAVKLAQATGQPDGPMYAAAQQFGVRFEQGRLEEVRDVWVQLVARKPDFPILRAMLALLYCEVDRTDEAKRLFENLAASDFADIPLDFLWSATISYLAAVAARLGDRLRAGSLYQLLAPHAGQIAGRAPLWDGSVAHYLGMLATTLEHYDQAEQRFAAAEATHERIPAPAWLARTRLEWARMLLARRQPRDAARAQALLAQVLVTARELGLGNVERRAVELLKRQ